MELTELKTETLHTRSQLTTADQLELNLLLRKNKKLNKLGQSY